MNVTDHDVSGIQVPLHLTGRDANRAGISKGLMVEESFPSHRRQNRGKRVPMDYPMTRCLLISAHRMGPASDAS